MEIHNDYKEIKRALSTLIDSFLEEFNEATRDILKTKDSEVLIKSIADGIYMLQELDKSSDEETSEVVSEIFHRTLLFIAETVIIYIKNSQEYRLRYSTDKNVKNVLENFELILQKNCQRINL